MSNRNHQPILDVGGEPGWLIKFTSRPVTVTNLTTGNVISNGLGLPFRNSSFEIVTNLDVLEHLTKIERPKLIAELLRVANSQVIFCTPLGSPEHNLKEKQLLTSLLNRGTPNLMLAEHVEYGLPSLQELNACIPPNLESKFFYSGDFRYNGLLFQIDQRLFDVKAPRLIRKIILVMLNLIGIVFLLPRSRSDNVQKYTNRVTVVLNKNTIGS